MTWSHTVSGDSPGGYTHAWEQPVVSIEVPLFANPLDEVLRIRDATGFNLRLYGGFPDSPLNGGRNNFSLDGWDTPARTLAPSRPADVVERAQAAFYRQVETANQAGLPFLLAFTNLFVAPEELVDEHLAPLARLVAWGQRYAVQNGVVLNHPSLDDLVQQRFGRALLRIASCTRFVRPERILSIPETMALYLNDAARFDLVVLTPQHSRQAAVLSTVCQEQPGRFVAISNAYCALGCNCHVHYRLISRENKRSLSTYTIEDIQRYATRLLHTYPACPLLTLQRQDLDVRGMARLQYQCGIRHFKLGRGLGADALGELVDSLHQEMAGPGPS